MDHKVSKDMISSGMIPSGEKTQADLGRTQYGSAPSPSSLMDAYKSIYEHHQKDADGKVIEHEEKEELNEGKMPEGLKNYLMKKKGKKEDKKDMKEGMASVVKAGVKAVKKIKKTMGDKPSPTVPESKPSEPSKPVPQMNDVDLFDLIKGRLIDEGCDEQEAIKIMTNLTEDELNQISEGLPLLAKGAMVVGGAVLAKKGLDKAKKSFDNYLNKQRNTSPIGGNTRPGADKVEFGK